MKLCGSPEISNTDLAIVFFLLEKSSWLLYIVMTLKMITYLLAVQGALLPECVHERSDRLDEGHVKMMRSGVSVLLQRC